MKIKSILFTAMFSFFTFAVLPVSAATDTNGEGTTVKEMTQEEYSEAITVLKERVEKLAVAKKNAQTKEEKNNVKSEIKEVKKEAKELERMQRRGGGFGLYIGGGALLIILLLILLL